MTHFTALAELQSTAGSRTILGYDFSTAFEGLARRGQADVAIVSTEDGFSPLGASREFFETDLAVSYDEEIRPLAHWNRFDNTRVTLVAIPSRNPGGLLRGIVLAPGSNTRSYERFGSAHGRPHRTYYYNVTYEAIAHICQQWRCRKLAISHLCSSGQFHEDMATCHAEALGHFCDDATHAAPDSFVFCGCFISPGQLAGIRQLNAESGMTKHRPIHVEAESRGVATLLHLQFG